MRDEVDQVLAACQLAAVKRVLKLGAAAARDRQIVDQDLELADAAAAVIRRADLQLHLRLDVLAIDQPLHCEA